MVWLNLVLQESVDRFLGFEYVTILYMFMLYAGINEECILLRSEY